MACRNSFFLATAASLLLIAACGDGGGGAPTRGDGAALDGSRSPDAAIAPEAAVRRDVWPPHDGNAAPPDLPVDAGWPRDVAPLPPPPDAAGAGPSSATVKLSYAGCSASFAAPNYVVVQNGTLTITAVTGVGLSASLQLVLKQTSGTITLSTKQRQQTGTIINLVTGGTTYTNITFDSQVYIGQAPDPIKGSITVNKLDWSSGVADLVLTGVTLENVMAPHNHCTLTGTVVTSGKSF